MGEITLPQCDIFKTVQRKGLDVIRVTVERLTDVPGKPETLHTAEVSVGIPGKCRVLRRAKAATEPPKRRGAGDA